MKNNKKEYKICMFCKGEERVKLVGHSKGREVYACVECMQVRLRKASRLK